MQTFLSLTAQLVQRTRLMEQHIAWMTRNEIYFQVLNTIEEVKVRISWPYMKRGTTHWFDLLKGTEEKLTWDKLKQSLIKRYGGWVHEDPFEELLAFRLFGTIKQYRGFCVDFLRGTKTTLTTIHEIFHEWSSAIFKLKGSHSSASKQSAVDQNG